MSHGLQLNSSHTWSKSFDTSFGNAGATSYVLGDYTNKHQRYGQTGFSRSQRFITAASYTFPRANLGSHLLGSAVNEWFTSAVVII